MTWQTRVSSTRRAIPRSFTSRRTPCVADGSLVEVTDDLERKTVVLKDGKREWRTLQFTFPRIETGAILDWTYELSSSSLFPLHWWEVQGELPVLEARFTVRRKQDALGSLGEL